MSERTKKEKINTFSRADEYDVLSMVLIGATVLFAVFWFGPVFKRLLQSFRDVWTSLYYYISEVSGNYGAVNATVAEIPSGLHSVVPTEWGTFKVKCIEYGRLLKSKENLKDCFSSLLSGVATVAFYVAQFLPLSLLLIVVLKTSYKNENTERGRKTKPLKAYLAFEKHVYHPAKNYIIGYVHHLRDKRIWWRVLAVLWLYNLNIITVLLELCAYAIYICMAWSTNISSLWPQVVKLVMDLSVPVSFLPWWLLLILAWKLFDGWRQRRGLEKLYACEEYNKAFLESHPGALFLVGKQRAKKTTTITDMALTQEVIFREKAQELLAERDKQFPHVPWQNVEDFYFITQENHTLPTLASCRRFIQTLRARFEDERMEGPKGDALLRLLNKKYGYIWNDFCFGYDWEKYGLIYNNALKEVNVFEAIEEYLQLFYIYAAPTSLMFSNYPIRSDITWDDKGNYPILCADFFAREPEETYDDSQQSHVLRWDSVRLLKLYNPADIYKDGFEVGVVNVMEMAKERGNQNTNAALKADDKKANVKNDGFELNMKIKTHDATIANYTFFRLLIDDHRPDSLSADNKDLCDVILIRGVSDAKIVMPCIGLERWLFKKTSALYDKVYYKLRNLRGDADGTLLVYLMKKFFHPIFKRYDRIKNKYSVYTTDLKIWDAMQSEVLDEGGKYFLCTKKVYAERFATDGLKQFYHKKALKSKVGLNDYPIFKDKHISTDEMRESGSRFYGDMITAFEKNQMLGQIEQNKTNRKAG